MNDTNLPGSTGGTSRRPASQTARGAHARIIGLLALSAAAGFAGLVAAGCSRSADAAGGSRGRGGAAADPVPVAVAAVATADIPVTVTTFGTVQPFATVAVKSQVGGTLSEVHVKEGQYVKAGDLLFVIDPRPYQAALGAAGANLEKDTAQAALARAEFTRTEQLVKSGIGSPSDYDKDKATLTSAEAAVNADKEAIQTAKLNLSYCYIASPIDGRTGELLITRGNTISANDVPLITINQVKPIAVAFSLPEQELSGVRDYAAATALDVEVTIPGREDRPERGSLAFIDNAVTSDTGTITLKGSFENADERLWPGQHVNVTLLLTTVKGAIVAPIPAVQDSQTGRYAYVVKPDNTVETRTVVAGDAYGDKIIIKEGLAPGETVVIEGHLKLTPGAKIVVKPPIAEKPAAGSVNVETASGAAGPGAAAAAAPAVPGPETPSGAAAQGPGGSSRQ